MTFDLLSALIVFAVVSSITPGPNNLMLMASGANFGLRRTIPHMLGISLGHGFMGFLLGIGLIAVFRAYPVIKQSMLVICSLYLAYLAWKIANAAAPKDAQADGKPLTFLQAAAFQWVNPKAVYMAITAQTYYAPGESGWRGALVVAVVFALVNLPSVSIWAWGGTQVRRWLATPSRLRAFNWTMAAALMATLIPILA
ncbi:LysE family translocator [Octadecabacter sp. SW4]|uniref:LysE family translocator n=1 Tax=Octadecabacter sp. SW4 TaxID=2602067 RepID=UPI0011C20538|nr:LysE family translocator [Octadecabacter sp. SW4]QEE35165.1 LysE family translocator [Octadecabacter sp. SW4]